MPPLFYRKDAWIQNVIGEALPGAHLYVCEQPADLTVKPPAPLVPVYRDPDGRYGAHDYPLVADGTGHFVYYAESDIYTEVYFYRGRLHKVLPDQGVGCYCAAGGGEGPVPWTFALTTDNVFGSPGPGALVLIYTAYTQQIFPPNFASPPSYGTCGENPVSPAVFTVEVNDDTVGTVMVHPNGEFSFHTPGFMMNPGDRLEVHAPDPADFSLSDVALSIVGTRIT